MRNIVLEIAYDGTDFFGWQTTSAGPSIESTITGVLSRILQEKISLQAASRTDRGVHAEGQIINFFSRQMHFCLQKLLNSLNALLPKSIRILSIKEVELSFHPTLDALGKMYTYDVCFSPIQLPACRGYSWHVPAHLDLENMLLASKKFCGYQDFSAFCNQRKHLNYPDKYRNLTQIKIEVIQEGYLRFSIQGTHFLYKMVRNIVGTLIYVGKNKISPFEIDQILASKQRAFAGITAPAHGLLLKKIFYPQEC